MTEALRVRAPPVAKCVSANVGANVSMRSVMNMIMRSSAAVAFLDSGATAAETMGPSGHPDAELITIASAAINLSRLCDEANAVADNLRGPVFERRPERPTELKARPTDGGITHISYERDHRTEAEHCNKC